MTHAPPVRFGRFEWVWRAGWLLRHTVGAMAAVAAFPAASAQTSPAPPAEAPAASAEEPRSPGARLEPADGMDGYYLRTCAVCQALLGAKGEALQVIEQGRTFRVCCEPCRAAFAADPAKAVARVDAVMIADQREYYPLKTSLLTDRPLGEQPTDFIWGNRLFRAVDAAERERILADPLAMIRKLDRAVIAAQTPVYGMPEKCPVQGDILPNERKIDIVVANRMVRVCCTRCVRVVRSRPYQYLGMVEYANREAARERQADASDPP